PRGVPGDGALVEGQRAARDVQAAPGPITAVAIVAPGDAARVVPGHGTLDERQRAAREVQAAPGPGEHCAASITDAERAVPARSESGPLSARLPTVKVLGTVRSSRASTRSGAAFPRDDRGAGETDRRDFADRNRRLNNMGRLLRGCGLR